MIDKIKNYIKSKCDSYEIFLDNATQQNIEISNTKIDFISQGSSQGLGIRVEIGKKIGFDASKGDYFIYLDADTELASKYTLDLLAKPLDIEAVFQEGERVGNILKQGMTEKELEEWLYS